MQDEVPQYRIDQLKSIIDTYNIGIWYKERDGYPSTFVKWTFGVFMWALALFSKDLEERFHNSISNAWGYWVLLDAGTDRDWSDPDTFRKIKHEVMHCVDFQEHHAWFLLTYVLLPLPVGISGRAHWEWRGYAQDLASKHRQFGYIPDYFKRHVRSQFKGGLYLWMFPFPDFIDKRISRLEKRLAERGEEEGILVETSFFW